MGRNVVQEVKGDDGSIIRLVSDPHDGSHDPRFFVESTFRFSREAPARDFFAALRDEITKRAPTT